MTAELKLYTGPRGPGSMIEWYLKELGVTASVVRLDFDNKEHKSPEFLETNPFGAVPALQDEGVNVFESGAILLYLAEKYGGATTPQKRARMAAWTHFANATVTAIALNEDFRKRHGAEALAALNRILGGQEYLEGSFSAADVAVGGWLVCIPLCAPDMDLAPYPNVVRYLHRLMERPACAATVRADEREKVRQNLPDVGGAAPAGAV